MIDSLLMARAMATIQERRLEHSRRVRSRNELLPAPAISEGQLVTYLKHKAFLPETSYGDLLAAIQSGQKNLMRKVLKVQQKRFNELNWFQKLFSETPSPENVRIKPIPAAYLMRRYHGKVSEFELFNALCELGEHRLIMLDTQQPYQVALTAKGEKVVQLLKDTTEPPSYEDTFQSSQSDASC